MKSLYMMAFPYHGLSRIPSLPYPVHPESGNKARIGGAATWFYRDETLLNSLLFWIYPLVMTNIANWNSSMKFLWRWLVRWDNRIYFD